MAPKARKSRGKGGIKFEKLFKTKKSPYAPGVSEYFFEVDPNNNRFVVSAIMGDRTTDRGLAYKILRLKMSKPTWEPTENLDSCREVVDLWRLKFKPIILSELEETQKGKEQKMKEKERKEEGKRKAKKGLDDKDWWIKMVGFNR